MCIVSEEVPLPLYSGCRLSSRRPRTSCAVGRVSELPWHSMCPHMMKTMLVGTSERLMSTNISELDVEPGREAGRQADGVAEAPRVQCSWCCWIHPLAAVSWNSSVILTCSW